MSIFTPSALKSIPQNNAKKDRSLANQIAKIDKEIDAMVYALYGSNKEEIKIVEEN
jgi:hypothetical protein